MSKTEIRSGEPSLFQDGGGFVFEATAGGGPAIQPVLTRREQLEHDHPGFNKPNLTTYEGRLSYAKDRLRVPWARKSDSLPSKCASLPTEFPDRKALSAEVDRNNS